MDNLKGITVLQRAPRLTVRLESNSEVLIYKDGRQIPGGSHSLAILDTFSRPTALSEGLNRLKQHATGQVDWIDMTSTVANLYKAGVLLGEDQVKPSLNERAVGFDSAAIQAPMLNDRRRTSSFLGAIEEVVRAGDVVADLGTGTGVLAMAAARAGAARVYAIEATSIGRVASTLFEANGLAERITLVPGWSTQVTLPERVDVLVSEIIGNDPLGERALEITADAVGRLVKRDARLIPGRLKILGLPVTIPRSSLMKRTFTPEALRKWQSWYGFEFGPLAEAFQSSPQTFYSNPSLARRWKTLSDPVLLADINLKKVGDLSIDNVVEFTATEKGELNGLIVYFEIELGPTTRLSTHPSAADRACSWRSPIWVIEPIRVLPSQRLKISYKYRAAEVSYSLNISRA